MPSAVKKPAANPAPEWAIEPATDADWAGVWEIFRDVVSTGDTYAYAPDISESKAHDVWMGKGTYGTGSHAFVVREGEKIIGTYSLRPCFHGLGAHVGNAGYMVHREYRGQGIAKALCQHSLRQAKRQGFKAIQFNFVVSTNTLAVNLWQQMGFQIIGVSPKSFQHLTHGLVDIYIMHRFLDDIPV